MDSNERKELRSIFVSVILPTRNRCSLLEKTLDSFENQTINKNNYEIIIVDDGSDDATEDIVREFKKSLPIKYFYLERTPKSGISRARNKAICESKGEVLIFIDGDQLLQPDYLAQHLRYHAISDNFLVIGYRDDLIDNKIVCDDRREITRKISNNWAGFNTAWQVSFTCNISVRRKWVIKSGGFDENMLNWGMEDLELSYRIKKLGVKLVLNPYMSTIHLPHERHTSENRYYSWKKNLDYFIEKHPERESKAQKLLVPASHHKTYMNYNWVDTLLRIEQYVLRYKRKINVVNVHIFDAEDLMENPSIIASFFGIEREEGILEVLIIENLSKIDKLKWKIDILLQLNNSWKNPLYFYEFEKKYKREILEKFEHSVKNIKYYN